MSSGRVGVPEERARTPHQSGGRAKDEAAPTTNDALPAPDEQPKAPSGDLATVRVKEVRIKGRMESYFSARAYEAGIEIGHVNASSKEAALAGVVALVMASWASTETATEGVKDREQ